MARLCGTALVGTGVSLLLAGCGGGAPSPSPLFKVCPGSTGIETCPASGCCPGIEASGGKDFPCPTSPPSEHGKCEGGLDGLVDALMGSLTREEKYKFVRGVGWQEPGWNPLQGYYVGNAAIGLPYGIPSQNMQDNGNGIRNDYLTRESKNLNGFEHDVEQVTSYPVSLAIASLWSEDAMKRFGEAIATEMRTRGVNVLLGPAVNVHRVPRNGRNAEYMSGESGYLGARLVKPYIRGVQGKGVLVSVKHFINNNQEGCRRNSDSIVDNRTRWEVYYPPFEAAVEADVAAQMCGYNFVNGKPNCGSREIMVRDLREIMGFKGWVQSDWWAVYSFDIVEEAGIDQEMPGTCGGEPECWDSYSKWYTDGNLNTLKDEKVNAMVRPQLYYMVKYGLLVPSEDTCTPGSETDSCNAKYYNLVSKTTESEALSKELATKAVTLLKNDGRPGDAARKSLPLDKTEKILLLGKACDASADVENQLGQWTNSNYYHIGGSGKVITKKPITIWQGVQDLCASAGYSCETAYVREEELAAAQAKVAEFQPATVLLCGGATSSEDSDRKHLKIDQEEFFNQVTADAAFSNLNKVVLTMTPGTIVMPWIGNTQAMANIFLPGKYAGAAFADVLFGVHNPSAKSPISYPKEEAGTIAPCDCVEGKDINPCEYKEKLNIAWYGMEKSRILFPFGHGLSYTMFSIDAPTVQTPPFANTCDTLKVGEGADPDRGAVVACIKSGATNSGNVKGATVVQLYLGFPEAAGEPPKLLRGFSHTGDLEPAGKTETYFPLYERDVQVWDETTFKWTRPAGTFKVYVGQSADDPNENEADLVFAADAGVEALV